MKSKVYPYTFITENEVSELTMHIYTAGVYASDSQLLITVHFQEPVPGNPLALEPLPSDSPQVSINDDSGTLVSLRTFDLQDLWRLQIWLLRKKIKIVQHLPRNVNLEFASKLEDSFQDHDIKHS